MAKASVRFNRDGYYNGRTVQRLLGCGPKMVNRLVERGMLGVFRIDGMPDRYIAEDVDALIAAGTRRATNRAGELAQA